MASRDSFLLRVDPRVMAAVRAWAADDLRSVNGQIEFLLRKLLQESGRLKPKAATKSRSARKKGKSG